MSDISEDSKTTQDKGPSNDEGILDVMPRYWAPRITHICELCMLASSSVTTLLITTSWPDDSLFFDFLGAVCTALMAFCLITQKRMEALRLRWATNHPEEAANIKPLPPVSCNLILYVVAIAAGIAVAELPVLVRSFSPFPPIWDPIYSELFNPSAAGILLAALFSVAIQICRSHMQVPAVRVLLWLAVSGFLIAIGCIIWFAFDSAVLTSFYSFPVALTVSVAASPAAIYLLAQGRIGNRKEFGESVSGHIYATIRNITIALMCAIILRYALFQTVTPLHNLVWNAFLRILLPKMIVLFGIVVALLGAEIFYPFHRMERTRRQGSISAEQYLCLRLGRDEDRELSDADIGLLWMSDAWQDPIVLVLIFAFLVVSEALLCSPSGNWGILGWALFAVFGLREYWKFSCYNETPLRTSATLICYSIIAAISLQFLNHGMVAAAVLLPILASVLLNQWQQGNGLEPHNRSYVEACLGAITMLAWCALAHTGYSPKRVAFVLLCFAMASAALWMTGHDDRKAAEVPIVDGRASDMNRIRFSIAAVYCLLMVFLNTAGSMSPILQEVPKGDSSAVVVAYPETDAWDTQVVSRRYASSDSLFNDPDSALNLSSQNDLGGDHITVWVVYADETTASADCWLSYDQNPWWQW